MLKHTSGTACQVFETVRYSSYGVPFGITPGDIEGDGDVDGDDNTNWPGSYQVRCDYDLDGDMDITDQNLTITNSGRVLGRGVLSHSSVGNRKGYCGYEHDGVIDTIAHVRHRVLLTELGRWSRRDPLGYVDGANLLQYVRAKPTKTLDSMGLYGDFGISYMWFHCNQQAMAGIEDEACKPQEPHNPGPGGGGPQLPPVPSPPGGCMPDSIRNNPSVRSAWQSAASACTQRGGSPPSMRCGDCPNPDDGGGYDSPSHSVTLCNWNRLTEHGRIGLIVHELTHARQACEYGANGVAFHEEWRNGYNVVCQEVEAYEREFSIPTPGGVQVGCGLRNPDSWEYIECICQHVCSSMPWTAPNPGDCRVQCTAVYPGCSGGRWILNRK